MTEEGKSEWWSTLIALSVTAGIHIIRVLRNISRQKTQDWHVVPTGTVGVRLCTMHNGSQLQARAITAPLSMCNFDLIANPKMQSEKFPIWKEPIDTPNEGERAAAARQLRAEGWSLHEWVGRLTRNDSFSSRLSIVPERLLLICNGIQSNYISPFGFTITDSRVVRPLRAIRKYPIVAGTEVWALVLQPRASRGLRRIQLSAVDVDIQTALDVSTGMRIVSAIEGPPLVREGRNVAHTIASSTGQRARPNAVLWPVSRTRAAFSAVGLLASGDIVFASIFSQESVRETAERLLRLGVEEAVLCGGSADVQQWVHPRLCTTAALGPSVLAASSRLGSTNPGNHRRLNSVFALTRKSQDDDIHTGSA